MPLPAPLNDPPPTAAQLADILAALGRLVTVASGDPAPTVLHLTRLLVAVAERDAVAAELALGAGARDSHDVDEHQDTYDTATVRAAFERLALAHWRARRLSATVTALRDTMLGVADDNDEDDYPSGTAEMWNLTVHTTIAADTVLAVLARAGHPAVRAYRRRSRPPRRGHRPAGQCRAFRRRTARDLGMDAEGGMTEEADAIPH